MDDAYFSMEEECLIFIYDTGDRISLITELERAVPYFEDPELQEITNNLIIKLTDMDDILFDELAFEIMQHYDYEMFDDSLYAIT